MKKNCKINPTAFRVPIKTCPHCNNRIRNLTISNIKHYKNYSKIEITRRIKTLNKEWDTERVLELNAASLVVVSSILGIKCSRAWFLVTGTIGAFLMQHALTGWCPPVPIIRKMGIRTQEEINEEKMALKVIRGDFSNVTEQTDATELYNMVIKQ